MLALYLTTNNTANAQNAGIGTTTPSNTLDVEDGRAAGCGVDINATNAGNANPLVNFQLSGVTKFSVGVDEVDASSFKIGLANLSTSTRLKIASDGNIGIGGGPTNARLHITDTVNVAGGLVRIQNDRVVGDADASLEFNLNGVSKFTIGSDDSDGDDFKMARGNALGVTDFFRANSADGRISIGAFAGSALTPIARFHVYDTANTAGGIVRIENNRVVGDADASIEFNLNNSGKWIMGSDDSNNDFFIISQSNQLGINDRLILDNIGNVTFAGNGNFNATSGVNNFKTNVAIGGASNATLHVTDTLTTSASGIRIQNDKIVGDADAKLEFNQNGVSLFSMGTDDSDADKFKISANNTLGVNDRLTIDGAGNVTIAQGLTVTGAFTPNGSIAMPVRAQSANYTATASDFFIYANSGGGAFTVTLPAIAGNTGKMFIIRRAGGSTVTVKGNAAENIEAANTYDITVDGTSLFIINDGGGWKIIKN